MSHDKKLEFMNHTAMGWDSPRPSEAEPRRRAFPGRPQGRGETLNPVLSPEERGKKTPGEITMMTLQKR